MNNTVLIPFLKNPVFWTGLFHVASILGFILGVILITQILRNPRKPSATIGWLLIIVLVPLVGIPLYLIFGGRKFIKLKKNKGVMLLPELNKTNQHALNTLLVSLGLPAASENNLIHFHQNGKHAWQELISLLRRAKQSVDIAIFILAKDKVGDKIIALLEQKASQGVTIKILLDGVGSLSLPKNKLTHLIKLGAKVAWFNPVLHLPFHTRTNLRNHRKMIIIDKKIVWTGGRNLAEEYLGEHCPKECWIDLSFTQQGSIVNIYQAIFDADWNFSNHDNSEVKLITKQQGSEGDSLIQIIPSGPDVTDDPIYVAVLSACYSAKNKISIVTPYFVPNSGIQEALKLAALRGVEVNLILPEKSNHRLADIARNRYLRELTSAGTKVWLISDKMVHAKAIVFDDDFAMAGSANLDNRSLFLNCEIMNGFYSQADISWLSRWLDDLKNQSSAYQPTPIGAVGELIEGIVLLGAYQL